MRTIQCWLTVLLVILTLPSAWAACSTPTRPSNLLDLQTEVPRSGKFFGWSWTEGARAGAILLVEGLVKDTDQPTVTLNADNTKATIGSGSLKVVLNVIKFRSTSGDAELAYSNLKACTPHTLLIRNITACDDPWRVVRFRAAGGCPNRPATLRLPATSRGPEVVEPSPGTFSLNERSQLDATFDVSDPDWPFQNIIYSLDDLSTKRGASLQVIRRPDGPDQIRILWPTQEIHGGQTWTCTVRLNQFQIVSANGDRNPIPVIDRNLSIVVAKTNNTTPRLALPPVVEVRECDPSNPLFINASAQDDDLPPGLIYRLEGAPAGMKISPAGLITWVPEEWQAPADYPIVVICQDENGDAARGSRSAKASILVKASEVNLTPFFTAFPPKMPPIRMAQGETLTWQVRAADQDLPAQSLTPSLVNPPPGATITPEGNVTFKAGGLELGSEVPIQVAFEDSGTPPRRCTDTFQVIVNHPPTTQSLGNLVVNEESPLRTTVPASDGDVPVQALTFTKIEGPSLLSVDALTGLIAWTPAETDGPGTFLIRIRITDNGVPSLSATNAFTLTVKEVNRPPIVGVLQRKVTEGANPPIDLQANDQDRPPQTLTYSLGTPNPASQGLKITVNAQTGRVEVIPGEEDGGRTFQVPVTVTDNGVPALSSQSLLILEVSEVNSPPSITIPNRITINAEATWTYTPSASDPDLPRQSLTYSLQLGTPAASGLKINASTGALTWKPTAAQANKTYPVYVKVVDNGSPPQSGMAEVLIKVNPKPRGGAIGMKTASGPGPLLDGLRVNRDGNQMVLRWPQEMGSLRVESSPVWPPRWESYPTAPDLRDDAWQLRIDAGPEAWFFRLVDPSPAK